MNKIAVPEWEKQIDSLPYSQAVINPSKIGDPMISREAVKNIFISHHAHLKERVGSLKKDIDIIKNAPFNPGLVIQKSIEYSNRAGYNEALDEVISLLE